MRQLLKHYYTEAAETSYSYANFDEQNNNQIVVTKESAGQYVASVDVDNYGDYHWAFIGEWADGYKKIAVGETEVERPKAFTPA